MAELAYPTHPNPAVQEEIDRAVTAGVFNVLLWEQCERDSLATSVTVALGHDTFLDASINRCRGALAVANAAEKRTLPTDDDLDGEQLGPACSVSGEACESCS